MRRKTRRGLLARQRRVSARRKIELRMFAPRQTQMIDAYLWKGSNSFFFFLSQRAFRERKERHVRDLEEKVNNLQQESSTLIADNDRLKRELARYSTENEILRATTNGPGSGGERGDGQRGPVSSGPTQTGPMIYSPTDFYSDLVPAGQSARLHRVTYCKVSGERLYDAGATWDMIQEHESFKKGLVDITGVTKRLKSAAQCDGQGPAFRECHIQKAIEESALEDCDGLL